MAAKGAAPGHVAAFAFAVLIAVVFQAIASWLGLASDYTSAVLPTMAGVIAGVPFAVWLIRLSEADERKRAEVAAAAERSRDAEDARTRRHAILSVIDNQLRRALKEVCGDRAGPPRELVLPYLPVEGWAAFSASGELQWINDAGLIAKIANA